MLTSPTATTAENHGAYHAPLGAAQVEVNILNSRSVKLKKLHHTRRIPAQAAAPISVLNNDMPYNEDKETAPAAKLRHLEGHTGMARLHLFYAARRHRGLPARLVDILVLPIHEPSNPGAICFSTQVRVPLLHARCAWRSLTHVPTTQRHHQRHT